MAQSGAAIGCSECFRCTFLPLSGCERSDLDLGTIKAFGTIQWFTLVTYRKRKHSLQPIFAVRSNVAVRGDSSPCSRCLWK